MTHISEFDAARDFAGLLARVRLGEEIVIESDSYPAAVLRPGDSAAPLHLRVHRTGRGPLEGAWLQASDGCRLRRRHGRDRPQPQAARHVGMGLISWA